MKKGEINRLYDMDTLYIRSTTRTCTCAVFIHVRSLKLVNQNDQKILLEKIRNLFSTFYDQQYYIINRAWPHTTNTPTTIQISYSSSLFAGR